MWWNLVGGDPGVGVGFVGDEKGFFLTLAVVLPHYSRFMNADVQPRFLLLMAWPSWWLSKRHTQWKVEFWPLILTRVKCFGKSSQGHVRWFAVWQCGAKMYYTYVHIYLSALFFSSSVFPISPSWWASIFKEWLSSSSSLSSLPCRANLASALFLHSQSQWNGTYNTKRTQVLVRFRNVWCVEYNVEMMMNFYTMTTAPTIKPSFFINWRLAGLFLMSVYPLRMHICVMRPLTLLLARTLSFMGKSLLNVEWMCVNKKLLFAFLCPFHVFVWEEEVRCTASHHDIIICWVIREKCFEIFVFTIPRSSQSGLRAYRNSSINLSP